MNTTGLIVLEDMATAMGGVLNAGYFAGYWLRSSGRRARRLGAAALTMVGVAAVSEAAFSQGVLLALSEVSDGVWALARLPLLLSTGLISVIVVRRMLS